MNPEYDPQIHGTYKQFQERYVTKKLPATLDSISPQGSAVFCISSPSVDRDRDTVSLTMDSFKNWFAAGAPWHVGHDSKGGVGVATSVDDQGELNVWQDGQKWYARAFFDLQDAESSRVYRALKTRRAGAASVAFVPLDSRERRGGGYDHRVCDISEVSIVSVPAHPEAVLQSVKSANKGPTVAKLIGKDASQGDSEGSGVPGRNANPEEIEEENTAYDPVRDEILERYGKAGDEPEEEADELLAEYRFPPSAGTDPEHIEGHGTNGMKKQCSPVHLAALTSHAREEAAFIDRLNDEQKAALGPGYIGKLIDRIKGLEDLFSSNFPDEDLNEHVAAFEKRFDQDASSSGVDGPSASGEALLINQGEIPDSEKDEANEGEVLADEDERQAEDAMIQAENYDRQQVVPKSWEDEPAAPEVIAAFARFEQFCRMHGMTGLGAARKGSGITAAQMFGHESPFTRSPR
jgi:hypothetical protein